MSRFSWIVRVALTDVPLLASGQSWADALDEEVAFPCLVHVSRAAISGLVRDFRRALRDPYCPEVVLVAWQRLLQASCLRWNIDLCQAWGPFVHIAVYHLPLDCASVARSLLLFWHAARLRLCGRAERLLWQSMLRVSCLRWRLVPFWHYVVYDFRF